MKKYLITYSLSIFYTLYLSAQTATKDTFLFSSTPWEIADIGNGITCQHYHFKDKQLFNANENIHILRLKNKSKKTQLAFASAGGLASSICLATIKNLTMKASEK